MQMQTKKLISNNRVIINYENITKNIEVLNRYNNKNIIAVVKNDAYNVGIVNTVLKCTNYGINTFAVANLTEALQINQFKLSVNIIILNPLDQVEFEIANNCGFHLLINSSTYLNIYSSYLDQIKDSKKEKSNIKFHLNIDVGMNRFGIKEAEVDLIHNQLKTDENFQDKVIGLMTHFPMADDVDLTRHYEQVKIFAQIYHKLKKDYNFKYIHAENSAAFLLKAKELEFCNFARVGILLYGYKPIESKISLLPTMFLQSKIVNINYLMPGDYLGYGEFKVKQKLKVGICPIGYGDGLIEQRKNFPVYIEGKFYEILTMSMSHIYIILDEEIELNDIVEIYGTNIKFDDIKTITNSKMMCPLKR